MSLFNDNLKSITIIEVLIILIASYLVLFVLSKLGFHFDEKLIYLIIIVYFIIKLRNYGDSFRDDLGNIFSKIQLKDIIFIVFLNIFFSYGMLYFSSWLLNYFPFLNVFVAFSLPSISLMNVLPIVGSFASTVIIASVSEELIFRGVFLSRLRLIVPTLYAILISSLFFGALHNFGSIFSAFVFAICMAILYLKTDNICVPILTHFLNNLFAEIIRLVDVSEILFNNANVMGIVSILSVISAIILFVFIFKELNNLK